MKISGFGSQFASDRCVFQESTREYDCIDNRP